MTINLRGRLPLVALVLGLTGSLVAPFAAPSMAQTAAKPTVPVDPEMRLRRIEAEIRAMQRKVFPDGAGKTFVPEIAAGQTTTAPAGTPADVVKLLQEESLKALKSSAVTARFATDNAIGGGGPASEFASFIAGEQKVWSDIVKRAQIRAD